MSDTIVWISGASYGIGAGLAEHCPFPGARVINLDRVASDVLETVRFDLTDPASWAEVSRHFEAELTGFTGTRAIFLLVGHAHIGSGLALRVDPANYQRALMANGVAPLALGLSFLRALPEAVEGGLMIMSSGAARFRIPGQTAYSAAKAGIEQWVRVMKAELDQAGSQHWVAAIRPGLVDTPSARETAQADPWLYPRAATMKENLATRAFTIEDAAKRIWRVLTPSPAHPVISFDEDPQGIKA